MATAHTGMAATAGVVKDTAASMDRNADAAMGTFAHDPGLARLPIPDLAATCAAIKELVRPFVDQQGEAATCAALAEFAAPDGAGEKLQCALRYWQKKLPGNASWLRPLWDDMYLSWREALPVNMNYYLALKPEPLGKALPAFVRDLAGVLLRLGRQTLPPEAVRSGFQAMDQLRSLIYTRIPGEGKDSLLLTPLSGPVSMAIVRSGHWFIAPLLDADGNVLSAAHFASVFAAICDTVRDLPPGIPVGAMTTASRSEAARIRADLLAEPLNRLSLASLEKSLFVVCLDGPETDGALDAEKRKQRFGRSLLGGTAGNRWFDKSLQIIASDAGDLGINLEHAGCDAAIWLYLLNQVMAAQPGTADGPEDRPKNHAGNHPEQQQSSGQAFSKLEWKIPDACGPLDSQTNTLQTSLKDSLKDSLLRCEQEFELKMNGIDLYALQLRRISSSRIKALRCSPDAFVQQAFQAAQHQVFGHLRSAYEAVAMRGFAEGRTECARPASTQALALACALRDFKQPSGSPASHAGTAPGTCPENSTPDKVDAATINALFRAAEAEHVARLKKCREGNGAERHMYGLRMMFTLFGESLGLKKLPAIFEDQGWQSLGVNAVSSSGISAPYLEFFGFGPVEHDGFGLGYCIGEEQVNVVITCHTAEASGYAPGELMGGHSPATDAAEVSPGDVLGAEDFAKALEDAVDTLLEALAC